MDDIGDGCGGSLEWPEGISGLLKGRANERCWEGRLGKKGEGKEEEEEGGEEDFGVVHDERMSDKDRKGMW